jgi:hypothetical protein
MSKTRCAAGAEAAHRLGSASRRAHVLNFCRATQAPFPCPTSNKSCFPPATGGKLDRDASNVALFALPASLLLDRLGGGPEAGARSGNRENELLRKNEGSIRNP